MLEKIITLILEIIKELIWPLVVIFVFCQLKNEIKLLIKRIKSVSAGNVTLDTSSQQQESKQNKDRNKKLAEDVKKHKNIQNKLLELQEITVKDKKIYEILYHFEKTYRLIFGSQLSILTLIFRSPNQKTSGALIEAFYRRTRWVGLYSFNNFVGFLLSSQLIRCNRDDTYSLTQLGFLFFDYIKKNNLSLYKPS